MSNNAPPSNAAFNAASDGASNEASSHTTGIRNLPDWLHHHGLLLCGFAWNDLPESITTLVLNACNPTASRSTVPSQHTTLWLLANAGPRFWRRLQDSQHYSQLNPIDSYSVALAQELQERFLQNAALTQLYPPTAHQTHIPLMRLGALANWSVASPLGLSLHPTFGPWFAYRCAWLSESPVVPEAFMVSPTHTEAEVAELALNPSLCLGCSAPCVKHCPAQAVSTEPGTLFNARRCHDYRAPSDSSCHTDCHARRACPVGKEHQYDDAQLAYHMGMRWKIS